MEGEKWTDRRRRAGEEAKRFPPLKESLRAKLKEIPVTENGYPCLVTLRDGTERDYVYLAPALPWFESWGVWPEDDRGKVALPLEEVADLRESPSRLPPAISDTLYEAGESGMGYVVFTLVFADGHEAPFVTGNAVDFPRLPEGRSASDIVAVKPHIGPRESWVPGAHSYAWCLYSE